MNAANVIKYIFMDGFNPNLLKLARACYKKVGTLTAEYSPSAEPVPYAQREELSYRTIKKGQVWARKSYACAWFHFRGTIPECAKGKKVAALFAIGSEGLVYDRNGNPKQGITGLRSFVEFAQPASGKKYYEITDCAEGNEVLDIWMDCGNNHMLGDIDMTVKLNQADIVVVNEEAKSTYYDALALVYQISLDECKGVKKKSARRALHKALAIAAKGDYKGASEILKAEYQVGEENPFTIYATGHAHLDLAWLWPIRETKRKAARTFANQLRNMERYPDYVFGASQPQQFAWMEEMYPELFEELKAAVARGQLEVQGGMWVECDTNVTSGESLIRQNLYGKRYWKEKFGKDMRMCWLPDVFGFSGNLPQILKKCGMDYFLTIKLSWNEHNKFPHRAFVWEGIDDSDVVVHMPPDETYNSEGNAWSLMNAIRNFPEKDKVKNISMLYGIGDGGGGPGEGHIEMLRHESDMKELPKVKFAHTIDFFDKLNEQKDELVRHKGELYLEKHQGTYTSQSNNKMNNRKIEFALHNVEFLASVAAKKGYVYPKEKIEKIWKEVLLYQFHDIIPGSSIHRVYEESVARYEVMLGELKEIREDILAFLGNKVEGVPTAINFNGVPFKGKVVYKDKWYNVDVPAYGSAKLTPYVAPERSLFSQTDDTIENDVYVVRFNQYGHIVSVYEKKTETEHCGKYFNKLSVYNDKRLHYNAWDIDINYTKQMPAEFKLQSYNVIVEDGAIIRENVYKYGKSKITQKVILRAGCPLIDFVTMVDWHETHKMLRAEFRPKNYADQVTCDIQMGNLKRSTRNQTKVEKAQFEICAHKWVDVSNENGGCSIITGSKYGWRAKEGLLSLNLLRSPVYPDPTCDRGSHTIRYAIYPHAGDYNEANTQSVAYNYNNAVYVTDYDVEIASQFNSSDEHVKIETVKMAENGEGVVVRMYEDTGVARKACITTAFEGTAYETNMIEEVIGEVDLNNLIFKPFEIKTIVIK
ncbi:MAG: alpha-mannosidase [Clostridia bacterium]|nr:alpha-mannosidase [Clostridia bacterium]